MVRRSLLGRGRVGGHRVGKVSGGGAGYRFKAKFTGTAQRHTDHAILEGKCWVIDGIVLHPSLSNAEPLGQAISFHQRGVADTSAHRWFFGDWEEFAEAPHCLRALGQGILGQRLLNFVVVVSDLKWAEVELAHMRCLERIFPPALAAL